MNFGDGVPLDLTINDRGVNIYNDSIATNPESTIAALETLPGPIVLLAGGYDKKLPFAGLAAAMKDRVRILVLTGQTADAIEESVRATKNPPVFDRIAGKPVRRFSPQIIGVTGSNGKTTTTALIGEILQRGPGKVWVGGNIRTSLIEHVDAIGPEDAYRLGIAARVTPHDRLMETTMELAARLAKGPTYSMALIKRLVHDSLHVGLAESLRMAGPAQDIARQTDDHKEGVRAFVEKRQPVYKGR